MPSLAQDELRHHIAECGGLDGAKKEAHRQSRKRLGINRHHHYDEVESVKFSLRLWGLNPEQQEEQQQKLQHQLLMNNIVELVKLGRHGGLIAYQPPSLVTLLPGPKPHNIYHICKVVFGNAVSARHRICCGVCVDRLREKFPMLPREPPYFYDRGTFKVKPSHIGFHASELDPLLRFYTEPVEDDQENLIKKYLETDTESEDRYGSRTVLRAAVIHTACTKHRCINCGGGGGIGATTLLWNAGDPECGQWRKIVCNQCGALYEIKFARNLPEKLYRGQIDGCGPFATYHSVRRNNPKSKMYLLLLDACCLDLKGSLAATTRPSVYVAEIIDVSPFITERSFVERDCKRIFTKVEIGEAQTWFQLNPILDTISNKQASPFDSPHGLMKDIAQRYLLQHAQLAAQADQQQQPPPLKQQQQKKKSVSKMTNSELATHIRQLRKKRMQIVQLEKKKKKNSSSGSSDSSEPLVVSEEDQSLLDSKDEILEN